MKNNYWINGFILFGAACILHFYSKFPIHDALEMGGIIAILFYLRDIEKKINQ